MLTIIAAILIFCVLIFVHELGHFIAAKACGVGVIEFSLGMGPRIIHFKGKETEYSLRILPIGGFCKMLGEDEENPDPKALNNKKAWQRGIVFGAGAFMNLVTAVVIMIALVMATGFPSDANVIGGLQKGMPAAVSGFKEGDKIVKIDGKQVDTWNEVTSTIAASENRELSIVVNRDGNEINLTCDVEKDKNGDSKIGIIPVMEKDYTKSVGKGFVATWNLGKNMIAVLGKLVTGEVSPRNLTGPVGIVVMVGDSVKTGISNIAFLTALISLNLAIFNLLPFPALDGGRILFLIIRSITKKEIPDSVEGKIHMVGLLLLFGLMIVVTIQDVWRFIL